MKQSTLLVSAAHSVFLTGFIFCVWAQGRPAELAVAREIESAGIVRDNLYTNKFLGLSYVLPRGFTAHVGPEARRVSESKGRSISQNTGLLLYALSTSAATVRSEIVIFAMPGKSSLDIVRAVALTASPQGKYRLKAEPQQEQYGGRAFWALHSEQAHPSKDQVSTWRFAVLVTEEKGVAVWWTFGVNQESELKKLLKTAESIRFSAGVTSRSPSR